jgi:predicted GNAT family N-acyltransferase
MDQNDIKVKKIQTAGDFEMAHKIRYEVFVIGQNVPEDMEYDTFEDVSTHFLAYAGEIPCGTARWRITEKGVKLERFAVAEKFRGLGVGSALVAKVLEDIAAKPQTKGKQLYLHAQISAAKLYAKFGFKQRGEIFKECDIDHYLMIR